MITLTSSATDHLQKVMGEKGIGDHALRVFVSGGGCSGLSYGMTFSEGAELGDQTFDINDVKVVVDRGRCAPFRGRFSSIRQATSTSTS